MGVSMMLEIAEVGNEDDQPGVDYMNHVLLPFPEKNEPPTNFQYLQRNENGKKDKKNILSKHPLMRVLLRVF